MKIWRLLIGFTIALANIPATATTFSLLASKQAAIAPPVNRVKQLVLANVNTLPYRDTRAQVIYGRNKQPDHVLVFLISKKTHKLDITRIDVNAQYEKLAVTENYQPTAEDFAQQPGLPATAATCPDSKIQFIVFAPNDDKFEHEISQSIEQYATSHNLNVVAYYGKTATRQNYLNAMACPQLKGNFYDGDGDPYVIVTNDGIISYQDITKVLAKKFRFKVTNIWLACLSFNDPIKSSMLRDAQSQKYAAGINDLDVGPSDMTAACAMVAAIDGKPMTASFQTCSAEYDDAHDQWGFDGSGTDYFGV